MRGAERFWVVLLVVAIHVGIGIALILGLRVRPGAIRSAVSQLIAIPVDLPPPPEATVDHSKPAAPAAPAPPGAPEGPSPVRKVTLDTTPAPVATAPAAGGRGAGGTAAGSGSGGGTGGDGAGGSDAVMVSGEIGERDYPRHLGRAGRGGLVLFRFMVGTDGRVRDCRTVRSSGTPELDALTCRLATERFRFRPATDRAGRPVDSSVEGDFDWISVQE